MIHVMRRSGSLYSLLLFFSILMIVLNPHTIFGKPGVLLAGFFAIYALMHGVKRTFFRDFMLPTLLLMVLATFGAFISIMNGIPQINHPLAVISFLVMILAANGIFLYCRKHKLSVDDLLLLILLVIFLNSVIICLELQFDVFRSLVESYLDPLSGGSIDYANGYRLRGIASSGGAGLSISIPAAITIAFYLFDKGKLSLTLLLIFFLCLLGSAVVIGRTGIILSVIPISTYLFLLLTRRMQIGSILKTLIFVVIFSLVIGPLFYQYITVVFSEMFGDAFIKYAFGFILDGRSGFEEEGTVNLMTEFITVLPLELPQALTGYGFYGGSFFSPWTDAGYNRTFLSIGFLFGSIFYCLIFYMYLLPLTENKYLLGTFVLILSIAEIKEPLLFSGVAARIFILVLIYYYCEKKLHTSKRF